MNILFATFSLDPERGGGTAERTRRLAQTLAATGHTCSVIALDGDAWTWEFDRAGIATWITGAFGRRFPVPRLNAIRLRRWIRRHDVVHVLGYWNLLSASVCVAARLSGVPYVLSAAGEFASLDRPGPVKRWFHRLVGRRMIAGAASLIAITELERTETAARLGIAGSRIVVVPNGVDEPSVAGDGRRLPPGDFVLFVGRLASIKGPDLLVDAFARVAERFPSVVLVMAGPDGGMRAALERRCGQLAIAERVRFLGFIDEAERVAAYRRALLLVIPSRSEAMSLVVLEAGAAAAPVLLTDRCGFDEVQGVGGGMVVQADVAALAAGLSAMLDRRDALPAMGRRLQELVRSRYGWRIMAARLADHLAEHLAASGGRST
jgi:glycosyltransferase involved in cell wall biosynthesis